MERICDCARPAPPPAATRLSSCATVTRGVCVVSASAVQSKTSIRLIAPRLIGQDAANQASIDALLILLDGTPDKSRLGANAILGVSLAAARAAAAAIRLPLWRYLGQGAVLPLPMINVISGGLHASHNLDFQDFMIMPVGAASYSQALEMSLEVHWAVRDLLLERGLSTLKADEGGFGPALPDNRAALDLLMAAVKRAGYRPGDEIAFALDVAATHFLPTRAWPIRPGFGRPDVRRLRIDRFIGGLGG